MALAMACRVSNSRVLINFAYESLRKLFDQLIERTINEQKTCMLGKAVLEFRGQDPQVAEIVNMGISQLENVILEILSKAQATGEISKGRDLQVLSSYLTAALPSMQVFCSLMVRSINWSNNFLNDS
jgi:hypothetical protein